VVLRSARQFFNTRRSLQVASAEWPIFVLHKKGGHAPVSFGDDPDASLIGEPVRGQNSESLLDAQVVLADVMLVKIAWIETDVLNQKSQRIIAAGLEGCCCSRCHHNLTERLSEMKDFFANSLLKRRQRIRFY
jgi:hypothetical protein